MAKAYIGVGSNIEPAKNVMEAIRLLRQHTNVTAISTFYQTKAFGHTNTEPFYNGVIAITTDITPYELKCLVLRDIEKQLERKRSSDKYAPRPIDLDILLYNDYVIHEPDLVIPDPDIFTREFVARPLMELAGDIAIPGSGGMLSDILEHLDLGYMVPLNEFTALLRGEDE